MRGEKAIGNLAKPDGVQAISTRILIIMLEFFTVSLLHRILVWCLQVNINSSLIPFYFGSYKRSIYVVFLLKNVSFF